MTAPNVEEVEVAHEKVDGAPVPEVAPAHRFEITPRMLLQNSVFLGFHVAAVACAIVTGVTWGGVALALAVCAVLMVGVTLGYHRYFSHRSFKTSRPVQFALALLGTLSLQKGVLWWAAHHRRHHRTSDTEDDIHSPTRHGLLWAHVGWIMSPDFHDTDLDGIKDMARFPELRWLNRMWLPIYVVACVATFLAFGFHAVVWGCFVPTVLLWHATYTINSLSHVVGKRVYATTDTSRNSFLLALITHGEGWHNNHHYYAASARQSFHWWQVDFSYYVLCVMEALGLAWDVKRPSADVVAGKIGGKNWLVDEVGDRGPDRAHVALPPVREPAGALVTGAFAHAHASGSVAAAVAAAAVVAGQVAPAFRAEGTPEAPSTATAPAAPPG